MSASPGQVVEGADLPGPRMGTIPRRLSGNFGTDEKGVPKAVSWAVPQMKPQGLWKEMDDDKVARDTKRHKKAQQLTGVEQRLSAMQQQQEALRMFSMQGALAEAEKKRLAQQKEQPPAIPKKFSMTDDPDMAEDADVVGPLPGADSPSAIPPSKSVRRLQTEDYYPAFGMFLVAVTVIVLMCIWTPHTTREDAHSAVMMKYQAHITSPIYGFSASDPLSLQLKDDPLDVIDIKMVLPRLNTHCGPAYEEAAHRRLLPGRPGRRLSTMSDAGSVVNGHSAEWCGKLGVDAGGYTGAGAAAPVTVTWTLYRGVSPDFTAVANKSYTLSTAVETEDLVSLFRDDIGGDTGGNVFIQLTTDSEEVLGALLEVVQMGAFAAERIPVAATLFVVTFALIVSEVVHRCYVTFAGSLVALFFLSIMHEAPHMHVVIGMIDFGTLMLLFSMMIVVHNLASTGFFEWFAVRVAIISDGKFVRIFFLLSILTGVLSAFLDNVTCVMLVGPVTINLCKQLEVDPVPLYLTETLLATIGGAATLIGDPPNVVIGNKLQIGFGDFLVYNAPLVVFLLPIAAAVMWYRVRHLVQTDKVVDLKTLAKDNPILDQRELLFVGVILGCIMLALFLSPIHKQEAAWFTVVGAMCSCVVHNHHNFRQFLDAVEWDTLFFFATLFVFVESLGEMGLIRELGDVLTDIFAEVPLDSRLPTACFIMLWVAGIGSAFLESLPFTTTVTYILISLMNNNTLEIPMMPLAWALSLGACIGGIGSIMGSSANLVAMSISERYSPKNPIQGKHFLMYGFPLLCILLTIGSLYQYVLFAVIEPYTYAEDG